MRFFNASTRKVVEDAAIRVMGASSFPLMIAATYKYCSDQLQKEQEIREKYPDMKIRHKQQCFGVGCIDVIEVIDEQGRAFRP